MEIQNSHMVEVSDAKALLASVRVVPGGQGVEKHGYLTLSLPVALMHRVFEASGVSRKLLHSRFPAFWLQLPPVILENLRVRGVYSDRDTAAYWDRHYYFECSESGRLSVRYQQISGGWLLAELSAEALEALVANCAKLVQEAYASC